MRSLLIVLALLLTACTGPPLAGTPSSPTRTSPTEILPDAQVAESVDDVVHRTPKELSAPRLASGLTPPTNRWYSGLVFGATPQPVFPLPLSFALTEDGFSFGLPTVTATENTIAGGHVPEAVSYTHLDVYKRQNVVFRRAAIDDVGGIYTDSKSEDVWTSLMLHERGWRSVYIPDVLAVGDAPETIEDYTKQQLRWATGGFEILFTRNPLNPRRKLTLDQRLMYLSLIHI